MESPTHNPGGYIEAVDDCQRPGLSRTRRDVLFNFFWASSPAGTLSSITMAGRSRWDRQVDRSLLRMRPMLRCSRTARTPTWTESCRRALSHVHTTCRIPITETATNSLGPAWTICTATCSGPVSHGNSSLCLPPFDEVVIGADVGPRSGSETYSLDNVAFTDGPPVAAAPTGRRARALKKCKKIKKKAKRRKCKKRARKLPV